MDHENAKLSANEFTNKEHIPKLNDYDLNFCDQDLTIEQCTLALKTLQNDKSPGSDGYTTNFYNFFWIDLKSFLYDSYMYSYSTTAILTQNQRCGILNLIPKKDKDLRYLANWRPVSLLNTDYKKL